jgi:hypothetical protein
MVRLLDELQVTRSLPRWLRPSEPELSFELFEACEEVG